MLKERKVLKIIETSWGEPEKGIIGCFTFDSWLGDLGVVIMEDSNKKNINEEEYYLTEFEASAFESDYHTYAQEYGFKGSLLTFNLNDLDTTKYFGEDLSTELVDSKKLLNGVTEILKEYDLIKELNVDYDISVEKNGYLQVVLLDKNLDKTLEAVSVEILRYIREYYDQLGIHITRMFGSYILLKKVGGVLKAIKATPVPIKYCPLMVKLLKEVGGEDSEELIHAINTEDPETQTKMMCNLIDKIVIQGGYFDTNRPLNSCEANVLFGASETIASAFKNELVDSAVIVSNNLGTIITTNDSNTQGAVKRMTGLFYTSPSKKIMEEADRAKIIPVFPYTSEIDQLEGVKEAIQRGYKKIAVTFAAHDNVLLKQVRELESDGITIYKFGLCSTGIDEETALIMKENADVIWSCASKYVKEIIEPAALAQVGIKIPVHIMTTRGWEIVKNHLSYMEFEDQDLEINYGEDKPVILNEKGKMKVLTKKEIHNCIDCPHPCV